MKPLIDKMWSEKQAIWDISTEYFTKSRHRNLYKKQLKRYKMGLTSVMENQELADDIDLFASKCRNMRYDKSKVLTINHEEKIILKANDFPLERVEKFLYLEEQL